VPPVDEEAISNVMVEKYLRTLDEKDYKIYILKRIGYTQEEIAKELGFSNNSAVSKRLSDMRKRFHEMTK
jgi:predicted transcriptional regulator